MRQHGKVTPMVDNNELSSCIHMRTKGTQTSTSNCILNKETRLAHEEAVVLPNPISNPLTARNCAQHQSKNQWKKKQ